MTERKTVTRRLADALAYALVRAELPSDAETSREYAERLAPLMAESGYLAALPESTDGGLREALKRASFGLRGIAAFTPVHEKQAIIEEARRLADEADAALAATQPATGGEA